MAGIPKGFRRINFNCDVALHTRLQAEVKRGATPISEIMRLALDEYLDKFTPMPVILNDARKLRELMEAERVAEQDLHLAPDPYLQPPPEEVIDPRLL